MPIYEYVCKKCGKPFEHLARTLTAPGPACPACGAKGATKQFSVFSTAESSAAGALPCASGACPSAAAASGGCTGGVCPLK